MFGSKPQSPAARSLMPKQLLEYYTLKDTRKNVNSTWFGYLGWKLQYHPLGWPSFVKLLGPGEQAWGWCTRLRNTPGLRPFEEEDPSDPTPRDDGVLSSYWPLHDFCQCLLVDLPTRFWRGACWQICRDSRGSWVIRPGHRRRGCCWQSVWSCGWRCGRACRCWRRGCRWGRRGSRGSWGNQRCSRQMRT